MYSRGLHPEVVFLKDFYKPAEMADLLEAPVHSQKRARSFPRLFGGFAGGSVLGKLTVGKPQNVFPHVGRCCLGNLTC